MTGHADLALRGGHLFVRCLTWCHSPPPAHIVFLGRRSLCTSVRASRRVKSPAGRSSARPSNVDLPQGDTSPVWAALLTEVGGWQGCGLNSSMEKSGQRECTEGRGDMESSSTSGFASSPFLTPRAFLPLGPTRHSSSVYTNLRLPQQF